MAKPKGKEDSKIEIIGIPSRKVCDRCGTQKGHFNPLCPLCTCRDFRVRDVACKPKEHKNQDGKVISIEYVWDDRQPWNSLEGNPELSEAWKTNRNEVLRQLHNERLRGIGRSMKVRLASLATLGVVVLGAFAFFCSFASNPKRQQRDVKERPTVSRGVTGSESAGSSYFSESTSSTQPLPGNQTLIREWEENEAARHR